MAGEVGAVECLLCRQSQSWPEYRQHLARSHGVMQGEAQHFILQVSGQKQAMVAAARCGAVHCSVQTEERGERCCRCGGQRSAMAEQRCWPCPLCPRLYTTFRYLELHLINSHGPTQGLSLSPVTLPYHQFLERRRASDTFQMFMKEKLVKGSLCDVKKDVVTKVKIEETETGETDSIKPVKPMKKETVTTSLKRKATETINTQTVKSFRATFPCKFCGEEFRQDYNLKLHLHTAHSEGGREVEEAKGEVGSMKLEGCVYQCKPCGNTFTVAQSFRRHIKDHHGLTSKQYREQHGEAEILTRSFICKLCKSSIKHTRNMITQHMKQVHGVSWKEYLGKEGEAAEVEMFHCKLCSRTVALRRQHLTKQHQVEEEVYEALWEGGPPGHLVTCLLCSRDCLHLGRHLARCHGSMGIQEYHRRTQEVKPAVAEEELACPAEDCGSKFARSHRLLMHVKTEHGEGREVWEEAVAVLTSGRRSAAGLACGVCGRQLAGRKEVWQHVTRAHAMTWEEYLEHHGDPATAATWSCAICGEETLHDGGRVAHHLRSRHDITWTQYKEGRGQGGKARGVKVAKVGKAVKENMKKTKIKEVKQEVEG